MLTHTGRKRGKLRYAVLELVSHDEMTDTYVVASRSGGTVGLVSQRDQETRGRNQRLW